MDVKLRKTPFSQVFIDNMSCFPPEQLEKIMSMDPEGTTGHKGKARFGKLLETGDFRDSGVTLFKTRNKAADKADTVSK